MRIFYPGFSHPLTAGFSFRELKVQDDENPDIEECSYVLGDSDSERVPVVLISEEGKECKKAIEEEGTALVSRSNRLEVTLKVTCTVYFTWYY